MNLKRILSFLLIAAMCLGLVPAGAFAEETAAETPAASETAVSEAETAEVTAGETDVLPEGEYLTEDGFQYRINEDGSVTITRYKGDAADLVVPATIEGKRVSGLGYNACLNNANLKSLVIEEGVGSIAEGVFYNCANLSKIDLPSTITSIAPNAFNYCALTDTNGFSKLTNLKENTYLYLMGNKITDLSGLKGLKLSGLYLDNNVDLKDLTPLYGMDSLMTLSLYGTAVEISDLWPLYRYEDMVLSVFDIGTAQYISPRPYVSIESNPLTSEITYTAADASVVTLGDNGYLTANKVGETTVTAAYKGESKTFKVTVRETDKAPDAGDAIENLPALELHRTPDGIVNLNLKENGELWNISADEPVLIKDDVKNITTSQLKNNQKSWLFIQDQEDSLWVQETKAGQEPTLTKKLENVAKYVGNNAYDIDRNAKTWAWVMHKEGGLSHIKPDGTVVAIPSATTKDISNLKPYSDDSVVGVTVLKEDGTIWVKLDPRAGQPETELIQLAENASALSGEKGFIDTDGNYHEIGVEWNSNTGKYQVVERLIADGALAVFSVRSGNFSDFYVDKNGATWALYFGDDYKTEKIGDMTIAYTPVYQSVYVQNPDTGLSVYSYVYYFQDTDKNLWKYDALTKETTKIAENVSKTAISSYGISNDKLKYLKTDGTYVDGDVKTSGVVDFMGDYLFMKDGQVRYRGQTILNSVITISSSTTDDNPATNNVTYASDCYMTRTDGSVWLHSASNPSVLTKVANYPVKVVSATGVSVTPATLELTLGDAAKQLTATVTPAGANNKAVKWASSNEKVAKVDENGMVTAAGAGKATITATTVDGGFTASCTVAVNKPVVHVTGITLNKTDETMDIGHYLTLSASVTPADADNKAVSWSTDNAAVATVDNDGKVTSQGAGTAYITATTADGGLTASCKVSVNAPKTPVAETPAIEPDKEVRAEVSNTEIAATVPKDVVAVNPDIEGAALKVEDVTVSGDAAVQQAVATTREAVENQIEAKSALVQLLDFSFVKGDKEVPFDGTQAGAAVALKVRLTPVQKDAYSYFQIYAVHDDGTLGELVGDKLKPDQDLNIAFKASHFSKYALVGIVEETVKPDNGGGTTPDVVPSNQDGQTVPVGTEVTVSGNAGTGISGASDTTVYLWAGALILAAVGLLAVYKRRANR